MSLGPQPPLSPKIAAISNRELRPVIPHTITQKGRLSTAAAVGHTKFLKRFEGLLFTCSTIILVVCVII
jgi:hypothetical protein